VEAQHRAARLLAAQRVQREELKRAGITSGFEDHDEQSIGKHIDAFIATVRAHGVCAKYLADREKCLRAYVAHVGAERLKDLEVASASAWLNDLKATGLSHRSVNTRYAALAQFGKWLRTARRWAFDPFEGLRALNEQEDQRHVRRALTPEEAERLVRAAEERPLKEAEAARIHAGVSDEERARLTRLGQTRALTWTLMMGVGLRTGEARRLRYQDVRDGTVHVPAASAKARRDQSVPLPPALAAMLEAFRPRDAKPGDTVIPPGAFPNGLTFDRDLAAAGIPKRDASDRVADRHALRHTFVSWIAAGGAHPKTTMALARHSSMDLSARYTDLALLDVKGAVERLPLPGTVAGRGAATAPSPRDRTEKSAEGA
jgi:integrase